MKLIEKSLELKIEKLITELEIRIHNQENLEEFLASQSYASLSGIIQKLLKKYPYSKKKAEYTIRFERAIDSAEEKAYSALIPLRLQEIRNKNKYAKENVVNGEGIHNKNNSQKYLNNRGGRRGKIPLEEKQGGIRIYTKLYEKNFVIYKLLG